MMKNVPKESIASQNIVARTEGPNHACVVVVDASAMAMAMAIAVCVNQTY
jgi:hypothetical protein